MARLYSSISVDTTLAAGINTTQTTMQVPSTSAATLLLGGETLAPGNVDIFTIVIDPDTINEEILYITDVSGDTFTISRGQAGTGTAGVSGIAHSAGATIRHVLTSDDLDYFRDGLPASIFTTKGDIVAANAAKTATRLGVGTNGQVLTANSATATGLSWAAPAPTIAGWTSLTSGTVTSGSTLVISGLSSYNRIMIGLTGINVSNTSSYLNYWANSKTENFIGTRIAISDNPPSGTGIAQIESTPVNTPFFFGVGAVVNSGISITITDNLTSAGKKVISKQVGNYSIALSPPVYTRADGDLIFDSSSAISSLSIGLEFGTATFTNGSYIVWGSVL